MNEDVLHTLRDLEARKEADGKARAEFTQAWRRLKSLRDGLASELDSRTPPMLPESAEDMLEDMLVPVRSRLSSLKADAETSRAALLLHEQSGGFLASLSSSWRERRRSLAADADAKATAFRTMESGMDGRIETLRRLAIDRAQDNRAQNRRAIKPLAGLRTKLNGVNTALAALDQGDTQVSACLKRWDIDSMLKVATLWRRLKEDGRLGERDYEFYLNAGNPVIAPADKEAGDFASRKIGDEGDIVRTQLGADGTIAGFLKGSFGSIPEGTNLRSLGVMRLAELLGELRMQGLGFDADLLEAYMDASTPTWRDIVSASFDNPEPTVAETEAESPYDILGVTKDTPMPEVKQALMQLMNAAQGLPNPAPQRRLIAAYRDIKALHDSASSSNKPT